MKKKTPRLEELDIGRHPVPSHPDGEVSAFQTQEYIHVDPNYLTGMEDEVATIGGSVGRRDSGSSEGSQSHDSQSISPPRTNTSSYRPTISPSKPLTRFHKPPTSPSKPPTSPSKPTASPSKPTASRSMSTAFLSRPRPLPHWPTNPPSEPTTFPSGPTTFPPRSTNPPSEPTTFHSGPTTSSSEPTTFPSGPTTSPARPAISPPEPTASPSEPTTSPSRLTTSSYRLTQGFKKQIDERRDVLEKMTRHIVPSAGSHRPEEFGPSLCHPSTRFSCLDKLWAPVRDASLGTRLIWLFGPAGVGKSGVMRCLKELIPLSAVAPATLFLPRGDGQSDPRKVFTTLAHSFALADPGYRRYLGSRMDLDPQFLDGPVHQQFNHLFDATSTREYLSDVSRRWVVILDGLDGCSGGAEILDVIIKSITLHSENTRLLWVIASRPEPDLKVLFAQAEKEIAGFCKIEMPPDSDLLSQELESYLHDAFLKISSNHAVRPAQSQFLLLAVAASGRLVFAETLVRYMGEENPALRLKNVLLSIDQSAAVPQDFALRARENPFHGLDQLYRRILADVPVDLLPVTKRILSYLVYTSEFSFHKASAQGLCNFLHLTQTVFYAALQHVRSVVDVPLPGAASQNVLRLYDSSFQDFLRDANRSGEFFIDERNAALDCGKLCLSWYLTFFSRGWPSSNHLYGPKVPPDLEWVSDHNREAICLQVARLGEENCWAACNKLDKRDKGLLSHIRSLDFKRIHNELDDRWYDFVNKLWELDPSMGIIRTKPRGRTDLQLLKHMESMTKFWEPVDPATFPLTFGFAKYPTRKYFLIGHVLNPIICWISSYLKHSRIEILNAENDPSKEQFDAYHDWLLQVEWFEADSEDAETEEE